MESFAQVTIASDLEQKELVNETSYCASDHVPLPLYQIDIDKGTEVLEFLFFSHYRSCQYYLYTAFYSISTKVKPVHHFTMPSITQLSLFFSLLALFQLSTSQICYFPDGSPAMSDTPCGTGLNSACCAAGSYCLSNGLCITNMILNRGSCTDPSWTAEECAPYCLDCRFPSSFPVMLERMPCSIVLFS